MTINDIKQIQQDSRYSIKKEFCGFKNKRYVLRFCGEFISCSDNINLCYLAAKTHHNKILLTNK